MKTFAHLITSELETEGITHIFGIPGGAIDPFYTALADSNLKIITTRHETSAAFAAAGFYLANQQLAICCSTSGPGATNMITGIASAKENNVPLLAITAQPSIHQFGQHPFQDSSDTAIDIVAMYKSCSGYSTLVSHKDQIYPKLSHAITHALSFKTPVHLSIPRDILLTPLPWNN